MGAFLPPRESAHTHFGLPKGDLPKSFLHNWSFFFFPLRWHIAESDTLWVSSIFYAPVGVFLCVCVHKRYFGVYFQEPVQMRHEFLCWHLYYVCQQIPSFKCWRLTAHGDDLHHHLQQYTHYIRLWPFLHCKAWLEHTWASAQSSVTRSSHTSRTGLRAR